MEVTEAQCESLRPASRKLTRADKFVIPFRGFLFTFLVIVQAAFVLQLGLTRLSIFDAPADNVTHHDIAFRSTDGAMTDGSVTDRSLGDWLPPGSDDESSSDYIRRFWLLGDMVTTILLCSGAINLCLAMIVYVFNPKKLAHRHVRWLEENQDRKTSVYGFHIGFMLGFMVVMNLYFYLCQYFDVNNGLERISWVFLIYFDILAALICLSCSSFGPEGVKKYNGDEESQRLVDSHDEKAGYQAI